MKLRRIAVALLSLLSLAAPALAGVPTIDAPELRSLMTKEPQELFLLDVRTPGEFQSGRIQGSVLVPMNDVPGRLGEIPRDKKIVVICASGARSGAVADFLLDRGYPWVRNYTGGIMDWSRRGYPLSR